ncbi:arsenite efflux transporter metallochaperone ArsD [Anaerocolumna xylanovorans]|uniref:Arsenical resistance operon trans-acting repressor ArsD n=1 Tax=Anaerocolumna xylanovorans DSM 12503 TaxID=1121345 RepID=A0A1M7YNI5_9FIRM|nr:arsenite efflux transporter metallochaperone ArsD [Anaerocolumna xylanovorans]SHO54147.1 Arsenical resistance operon trans-acting repressor ArsD [Anaerocolumna xylanovorans DSM 12503]
MSKIEIFEPPMCCSTGVCGSSADPELLRIAELLENLKKEGIEVARYNLSSDPKAFMQSEGISNALNQRGADVLPITVVDGRIIKSEGYPTNEEVVHLLGISSDAIQPAVKVQVNKCSCSSKGCC